MANRTVFEPKEAGSPFVAAIFGENGLLVASKTFSSRAEAESFIASDAADPAEEVLLSDGGEKASRGTYDHATE